MSKEALAIKNILDKFILDENNNVIPATLLDWGKFLELSDKRRVDHTEINGYIISTVFIGLDHNWCLEPDHKIHVFETMVFKGKGYNDIYCDRYSTWDEAVEGHKKAIEWVENRCKEDGA